METMKLRERSQRHEVSRTKGGIYGMELKLDVAQEEPSQTSKPKGSFKMKYRLFGYPSDREP